MSYKPNKLLGSPRQTWVEWFCPWCLPRLNRIRKKDVPEGTREGGEQSPNPPLALQKRGSWNDSVKHFPKRTKVSRRPGVTVEQLSPPEGGARCSKRYLRPGRMAHGGKGLLCKPVTLNSVHRSCIKLEGESRQTII